MSQRNVDDDLDWQYAESKFEELRRANALLMAWAPVIEAAKAWRAEKWNIFQAQRLDRTIEALEAAEGG